MDNFLSENVAVVTVAVRPDGYDDMISPEKDNFCLIVMCMGDGTFSITRGLGSTRGSALRMNADGTFALESSVEDNSSRRWDFSTAVQVAQDNVNTHQIRGVNVTMNEQWHREQAQT